MGCGAEVNQTSDERNVGWGVYDDQPPVFITQGNNQGQGMADKLYLELHRQLPGYNHHFIQAKLLRIIVKVSAGEKICAPTVTQGSIAHELSSACFWLDASTTYWNIAG